MVHFLNNCKCFHIIWETTLDNKQLRYILYLLCLLSCRGIAKGKEAALQRRFMWKQMHLDNLVGNMATRPYSIKHMTSDLAPNGHSALTNKLFNYLPSETTRVKYIIHNPTTKKPMKIIKIRPSKKIVKIITKPTITTDSKTVNSYKSTMPAYLNSDQMEKMEKEQELIAEGQLSVKSGDVYQQNLLSENEKYSLQASQEMTDEQNSWLPVFDTSEVGSTNSPLKPNTLSPLHTSFMAESLPKPEKQISHQTLLTVGEQDQYNDHDYQNQKIQSNGYEVTEHIAEESIAIPLMQGSHISLLTTPSKFSLIQPTITAYRDKFVSTITPSTLTEEPPNYPANFLRRFQERLQTTTILPPTNSASAGLLTRSKQRKNSEELNGDWTPSNISNPRDAFKLRGRFHSLSSRVKTEKWPPEVATSTSQFPSDKLPIFGNYGEMRHSVLISTTTNPILATDIKEQVTSPPTGRSRKAPPSAAVKVRQTLELPRLQSNREHNRGSIKFGDKIFT
ncbi:PREDICTED: uncharacterized protein LOC108970804 isoform X1 [Bactrocera latifrons]|uniref:Uncharacterized protein n=2 Tax=Bactrocera latifrons TaxID=174628 RepID=A0A0K8UYH3_BACLA|nr:PREDICTED: uncharacterized protein LOC108970804 isoform X1 [Bactrocera latifrons]